MQKKIRRDGSELFVVWFVHLLLTAISLWRSGMKIKGMVAFALMLTALSGGGRMVGAQSTPQGDAAGVDRLIHAAWQQKGIVPAKPADDARYLRRIYLDITGAIPPEQVVSEFLAD